MENSNMNDIYRGADAAVSSEFTQAIKEQAQTLISELLERIPIKQGDIFVVGCSSSEILGSQIGKGSSFEAARILFEVLAPTLKEKGIYLAAQCCEHLNRALVIEKECAEKYFYEPVSVIPQPKAGGSFATIAYESMENPVVVEHIKAHAGIDIGGTLIGMHLRDVAVPIRTQISQIGSANVICAYTRSKFIGGSRAVY
jgi:uncharacterized protein (TIGR01440 family)